MTHSHGQSPEFAIAHKLVSQARPDQIRRLLDDIRNSGSDETQTPRGTA